MNPEREKFIERVSPLSPQVLWRAPWWGRLTLQYWLPIIGPIRARRFARQLECEEVSAISQAHGDRCRSDIAELRQIYLSKGGNPIGFADWLNFLRTTILSNAVDGWSDMYPVIKQSMLSFRNWSGAEPVSEFTEYMGFVTRIVELMGDRFKPERHLLLYQTSKYIDELSSIWHKRNKDINTWGSGSAHAFTIAGMGAVNPEEGLIFLYAIMTLQCQSGEYPSLCEIEWGLRDYHAHFADIEFPMRWLYFALQSLRRIVPGESAHYSKLCIRDMAELIFRRIFLPMKRMDDIHGGRREVADYDRHRHYASQPGRTLMLLCSVVAHLHSRNDQQYETPEGCISFIERIFITMCALHDLPKGPFMVEMSEVDRIFALTGRTV